MIISSSSSPRRIILTSRLSDSRSHRRIIASDVDGHEPIDDSPDHRVEVHQIVDQLTDLVVDEVAASDSLHEALPVVVHGLIELDDHVA